MPQDNNSTKPPEISTLDFFDRALPLTVAGWSVFPLTPGDKKPLVKWRDESTTNVEQLAAWCERWPAANVGIDCEKSGLYVIDLDGEAGREAWRELAKNHTMPDTIEAITGGGGAHIYCQLPNGDWTNTAGKLAEHIDTRGAGGYVVGPSSLHPSGNLYTWQPGKDPESAKLAPLPDWIKDTLQAPEKPPEAPQKPYKGNLGPNVDKWLSQALTEAHQGSRNDWGLWLACQLRDDGISQGEALGLPYPERVTQGKERYSRKEWEATVKSVYSKPARDPARGAGGAMSNVSFSSPPMPEDDQGEAKPPATWADIDGVLGPIEWAWDGWLPKGMLTILAGESGGGKSSLALRLAACFLRRDPWPDGTKFDGDLGAVLWCEAEAAQAINLDRAKKWGLPIKKIYTPLDNPLQDWRLDNPDFLGKLASKAMLPEVRFIVVDSLRGATGGDENSSELGNKVMWLAALARDCGKPILLTHHLRKRGIFDLDGINQDRLRGSSAIIQPARVAWALDRPDQNQKEALRLQQIKNNLAPYPEPVGMIINDAGVKFIDAPEPPRTETVADKAADLLLALLRDEPMPSKELQDEVEGAGISWVSAKRAKAKLGIVSIRKDDGWYWALPAKDSGYAS